MHPARTVTRTAWRGDAATDGPRTIPEETPVALTYNRTAHAVMLATPADLEDFAIGFSLTEGIIQRAAEIEEIEIVPADEGIELRMWLAPDRIDALTVRQRRLAGPSGCGLCGLQSLADAIRQPPRVAADPRFTPANRHCGHGGDAGGPAPQPADPRGARRRFLASRARHGRAAGGCRPPQRAGQTRRCSVARRRRRRRRTAAAVEPHLGRVGAEGRHARRARGGRGIGTDGARLASGRNRRHYVDRHRPRRRIRSLHPRRAHCARVGAAAIAAQKVQHVA